MPVFEYKCNDCENKFEVFHKSRSSKEEIKCPSCESENYQKLFSAFSSSVKSSFSAPSCASGQCGMPSVPSGGCANGMCGL